MIEEKFTKSNFIRVSQEALDFLKALDPVGVKGDPVRGNLVFLNHHRNSSTFLSIKYLVERQRVADIYSLSRSMFESIISMALLSKQLIPQDIERYQDFQYIEIYKTYNHLKQIGLERLSGVSASEVGFLNSKRNEYVSKWGRSAATWTGKPLEQNVKLVDEAYAPTCNEEHFYEYLYCQVYRKGSQAAHSSFGGLAKSVEVNRVMIDDVPLLKFKASQPHLIFSCFHSLLVFLSSARFLGYIAGRKDVEDYFQKTARYIVSEE